MRHKSEVGFCGPGTRAKRAPPENLSMSNAVENLTVPGGREKLEKLGIIVEGFQIGILARPVEVGVAGGERAPEKIEGLGLFSQYGVSARGVVENVGIIGTKRDGHLQVPGGVIRTVHLGIVGGKQATGANVLGDEFKLALEDAHFHFAVALELSETAKAFEGVQEGNKHFVVIAIRLDRFFGEIGGLLEAAGSKVGASKDVVDPFAVRFESDGAFG